jgi:tRNA dimethylallyltransferase
VRIVLEVEKDLLNRNIARRFEAMLEEGALDEVRAFAHWGRPAAQVIGAAELRAFLAGEVGLAEAAGAAVTATRQLAKRQRTWFRGRMRDWRRLEAGAGLDLADLEA